jgi:hypothetical protein
MGRVAVLAGLHASASPRSSSGAFESGLRSIGDYYSADLIVIGYRKLLWAGTRESLSMDWKANELLLTEPKFGSWASFRQLSFFLGRTTI